MAGYAKGVLIALIVSIAIVILMNFAFFFPWYITLIETTFEVAQVVSNENFLPYDTYEDIYNELKEKPIFKDKPDAISIEVTHYNGEDALERSPGQDVDNYYNSSYKPYVQRGNIATVTVRATYPFKMKLAGNEIIAADFPVEFHIDTTTLKHYKDLDYYTP